MIGKRHEYEAMANCEKNLWWYKNLHDLTIQQLRKYSPLDNPKILDAGCGTGGMLSALKNSGYHDLHGFDFSVDALEYCRQTLDVSVKHANILEADKYYPLHSFDVIISHDVICLLQQGQDREALQSLLKLLKPGGIILMNLPALDAFKGTHDIAVNITKRYNKRLVRELTAGTASILSTVYWPFLLSPVIYLVRAVQRLTLKAGKKEEAIASDVKMPPAAVNNIFYKMIRIENSILPDKPWGSSIFAILKSSD
jgi:SAM-dependent methyltransferase